MPPGPALRPDVFPTGDGERSSAGSNDGDWRPAQPPAPHGYDFEKRFVPPALDPDFKPLRDEPERDLDAPDSHGLDARKPAGTAGLGRAP